MVMIATKLVNNKPIEKLKKSIILSPKTHLFIHPPWWKEPRIGHTLFHRFVMVKDQYNYIPYVLQDDAAFQTYLLRGKIQELLPNV